MSRIESINDGVPFDRYPFDAKRIMVQLNPDGWGHSTSWDGSKNPRNDAELIGTLHVSKLFAPSNRLERTEVLYHPTLHGITGTLEELTRIAYDAGLLAFYFRD